MQPNISNKTGYIDLVPLTTLGRETRWVYSKAPGPHWSIEIAKEA